MKEQIVKAEYNPETGVSEMIKVNKYGCFHAKSVVHEEDADIANRWDGLRFCELKIDIEVAKAKATMLRERANGIRSAIMAIEPPEPGEEDYTFDKLLFQYQDARNRYEDQYTKYKRMKSMYHEIADTVLSTRRRMRREYASTER